MSQSRREPYERIAPRDDHLGSVAVLSEMLVGEFTEGTWLAYHDLRLLKRGMAGSSGVWEVFRDDDQTQPIEVLNTKAFRTATALENCLARLLVGE